MMLHVLISALAVFFIPTAALQVQNEATAASNVGLSIGASLKSSISHDMVRNVPQARPRPSRIRLHTMSRAVTKKDCPLVPCVLLRTAARRTSMRMYLVYRDTLFHFKFPRSLFTSRFVKFRPDSRRERKSVRRLKRCILRRLRNRCDDAEHSERLKASDDGTGEGEGEGEGDDEDLECPINTVEGCGRDGHIEFLYVEPANLH